MLELFELSVRYGEKNSRFSLDKVTMSLKNEKAVIVGPNGSGKTTLLKSILGLSPISSGTAKVYGTDVKRISNDIRVSTNIVDVYRLLRLNVEDIIELYSELKNSTPEEPEQMLADFGLKSVRRKKMYQLSAGEQKMICNIMALSFSPGLILLDEPFDNVDQARRLSLASMLNETDGEIILNTHEFDLLNRLADWDMYFMIEGKLFGKFRVSQLKDLYLNKGEIPGGLSFVDTSYGKFSITEKSGEVPIFGARSFDYALDEVA